MGNQESGSLECWHALSQENFSRFDRPKLVDLIHTFQAAIVEIASDLDAKADSLNPEQIKDRRYVAGVATLCAVNCEKLLEIPQSDEAASLAIYNQFMDEAQNFALIIKNSGLLQEN